MRSPRHHARGDAAKSDIAQRFIGTWPLVSIDDPTRGPHPIGILIRSIMGSFPRELSTHHQETWLSATLKPPTARRT